jgi:hypothetical protein
MLLNDKLGSLTIRLNVLSGFSSLLKKLAKVISGICPLKYAEGNPKVKLANGLIPGFNKLL